jgi:hypothetical protein
VKRLQNGASICCRCEIERRDVIADHLLLVSATETPPFESPRLVAPSPPDQVSRRLVSAFLTVQHGIHSWPSPSPSGHVRASLHSLCILA